MQPGDYIYTLELASKIPIYLNLVWCRSFEMNQQQANKG